MDKKSSKINSLIFKGPSNSGKTLICNSIKHSFLSFADISQGITNNFWLQPAKGKRIIFNDEVQYCEEHQERLKCLLGGQLTPYSIKGQPDETLPCTPYMAACNTWPWCQILNTSHVEAFKNRCHIYNVKKPPWLEEFQDEGDKFNRLVGNDEQD